MRWGGRTWDDICLERIAGRRLEKKADWRQIRHSGRGLIYSREGLQRVYSERADHSEQHWQYVEHPVLPP